MTSLIKHTNELEVRDITEIILHRASINQQEEISRYASGIVSLAAQISELQVEEKKLKTLVSQDAKVLRLKAIRKKIKTLSRTHEIVVDRYTTSAKLILMDIPAGELSDEIKFLKEGKDNG